MSPSSLRLCCTASSAVLRFRPQPAALRLAYIAIAYLTTPRSPPCKNLCRKPFIDRPRRLRHRDRFRRPLGRAPPHSLTSSVLGGWAASRGRVSLRFSD